MANTDDLKTLKAKITQLEHAHQKLQEQYRDPQRAPIEHVSGPRLGLEVLNRLKSAKKSAGDNRALVGQIDSIIAAIRLGDELVKKGALLCW